MRVRSTVLLSAALAARLMSADLVGVVTDGETGEPVTGAIVSLDDLGRSVLTDESGMYHVTGVPPGPQHLSVEVLGYQSRSVHVLVPAGGTLRVDLVLRREPIEVEALIVRSPIPIRGVESEGPDLDPVRRLSAAAIKNDPFTPEPDVLQALVGGDVGAAEESGGGLHVRGGGQDQVGYLLDGIPVFSPYHSGLRSGAWSPDAVAGVELGADPTQPVDGLSGAVSARTVEPGDRWRTRGEASTGQVGVALDGPLGGSAGLLVSARAGFAGLVYHPDEPSYLQGEDHDVIGKVTWDVAGGEVALLAFDNRNVIEALSTSDIDETGGEKNRFEWRARSFGARWESGGDAGTRWSARVWRATLDASALWNGQHAGRSSVHGEREEWGGVASAAWEGAWGTLELGARGFLDEAAYRTAPEATNAEPLEVAGRARTIGAFGKAMWTVGPAGEIRLDLVAETGTTGERFLPRVAGTWRLGEAGSVYGEYAHTAQVHQSLRNPESVVGRIFPTELYAGGEGSGIPVARSRTGAAGVVAIPWAGARLQVEGYARTFDDLALVAPAEDGPFAQGSVVTGTGTARGAWVGLSTSAARYALLATYGAERVRLTADSVTYAPAHTASQRLRLGAIVFPTATLSVRVAWVADFGRRGTDVLGGFEWESCNLLDQGCEFAGSPDDLGALGGRDLPGYRRLDLSVRKHWHLAVAGRDARIEAFATATNLTARSNVLVYVVDPDTGAVAPIEMRPLSPLTIGVAWSF